MLGVMDAAVLERLAKIMGYMKMSSGGTKGARKLKRREKMRMLAAESGQLPSGGLSIWRNASILKVLLVSPEGLLHLLVSCHPHALWKAGGWTHRTIPFKTTAVHGSYSYSEACPPLNASMHDWLPVWQTFVRDV